MEKEFKENSDYYALGVPEKALELTVYDSSELMAFLKFSRFKERTDIEREGENYVLFSRNVEGLGDALNVMKEVRSELVSLFEPYDILKINNLGFWRMLYRSCEVIIDRKVGRKESGNVFGAHYSIENRGVGSIIRAKGKSFYDTQRLFIEAANRIDY